MSIRERFWKLVCSRRDCRALALALWSLLGLLAATSWLLRIVAELSDAGLSVLATAVSLALSLVCYGIWSSDPVPRGESRRLPELARALTFPALIGLAFTTWQSRFELWAIGWLLASGCLATVAIRRRERVVPVPIHPQSTALAIVPRDLEEEADVSDDEPAGFDPTVHHSLVRRVSGEIETVEGSIRILLAACQQVAYAHVAFLPPLAARPAAECHLLSAFNGRVKVAATHAYGLRIEARRSEASGPAAIIDVAFEAQTRAAQSNAA